MYTRYLVLSLLLITLSSFAVSDSIRRACTVFGHGNIASFAGDQFRITEPGDYVVTSDFVVRMEQCPGSKTGAVCVTGFKYDDDEYYYNSISNVLEYYDTNNDRWDELPSEATEFGGVIPGFHVEESTDKYEATFTPFGSSITLRLFLADPANNRTLGICGRRGFLGGGQPDENMENSFELFYPSDASQTEINQFAHTHTVNKKSSYESSEFKGYEKRTDPAFGDFSAWKSYQPKSLSESTCSRIAQVNKFLGAACSYDVQAKGTNEARIASYWALRDSCYTLSTEDQNGLVGLFPDYDDLSICQAIIEPEYMDALHAFKDTDEHPFDADYVSLNSDNAIVNREGNIQGRYAINPNHNVGGKYEYNLKYRDECGKEIDYTTNIDIRCNAPPTANAGEDMTVMQGYPTLLKAGMSDEDGDNLMLSWKFIDWPGKTATQDYPSQPGQVKDPYGYGSEYFHFQPSMVGDYVIELAVSDYCNVAFDTITITAMCTDCPEKFLVYHSQNEFVADATDRTSLSYGSVDFDIYGPGFSSQDYDSVEVSVRDSDYQLKRDDDPDDFKNTYWEVRTAYEETDPVVVSTDTDSTPYTCNTTRDTVGFVQELRIPPYGARGKTVVVNDDVLNSQYTDKYRRNGREVLHQRYECYETRTVTTTTKYSVTYNPPTTAVCRLDSTEDLESSTLTFDYERLTPGGTPSYSLNRCDHVFDFTFNATSECGSKQSTMATVSSVCPQPQSNPTGADIVYFDYDAGAFQHKVDLHGYDSSSGAIADLDSNTNYPYNGWLNFKWTTMDGYSLDDEDVVEPILTLNSEGVYNVPLTVDNGCRYHTDTVRVEAVCTLPAPENLDSGITITDVSDPTQTVEVNVTGITMGRDDLSPETTVKVTYPDLLSQHVSTVQEYVTSDLTFENPQTLLEDVSGEGTNDAALVNSRFQTSGSHTFDVEVSDKCRSSSIQRSLDFNCPYSDFDVEFTFNGETVTGEQDPITLDSSGYPDYNLSITTSGNDISPTFFFFYKWITPNDADPNTLNSIPASGDTEESISDSLDSPGFFSWEYLVTDSQLCNFKEPVSTSINVLCPTITLSATSPQTAVRTAAKANETQIVDFSVEFNADNDIELRGEWLLSPALRGGVVVTDSNITDIDAHYRFEFDNPYLPIGSYDITFRLFRWLDGNPVKGCPNADDEKTITFTLQITCPDLPTVSTSSPSTSYSFADNSFPSIYVKGELSGNDEWTTPIDEYKYYWIFTSVPEDSSYFPETAMIGDEIKYDYDYDISSTENTTTNSDDVEMIEGRTITEEQTDYYYTRKLYRHSVLNAQHISFPSNGDDLGFDEFAILYNEDDHNFDGEFVPDVAGDYTLRFVTRPRLGDENIWPEECTLQDTITVSVGCNNAPTVALEGADDSGVLTMTKTAFNSERVQLHYIVTNDDHTMLMSEFTSTPYDTFGDIDTPRLWETHSADPSFLATRAGDYVIRVTADDGCTRNTFEFTVRVSCSNGISYAENSQSYEVDYSSKVDISQMSFRVVPESNDRFSCMVNEIADPANIDDPQQPGLIDFELVSWQPPSRIPTPEPSDSGSGSDAEETTSGAIPVAVFQPAAILASIAVAIVGLLM